MMTEHDDPHGRGDVEVVAVERTIIDEAPPAAPPPPAPDGGVPPPPRPWWRRRPGLRAVAAIGYVLALLFAVTAALLYVQSADLRAEREARASALEAGEVVALRVTTFDGATIDQWVADTQELATGEYADQVAQLFDNEIRQGLAANEVQSVGEVTSSFVQSADDDAAVVFAVVRQTFSSVSQERPVSDELRMEITLVRVDGEWLASDVAVLGPSVISPVDPEAGQ